MTVPCVVVVFPHAAASAVEKELGGGVVDISALNGLVSADGEVAMLWFKQTDTSSIVAVWNGNDDDDGGGGSRPATGEPADLAWLATAALSRLLRKNNNGTVPMLRGDVVFARIENDNNVGCLRLSEIM